jgi:hypothetical protein
VRVFCSVIIRCTETFWSLCTSSSHFDSILVRYIRHLSGLADSPVQTLPTDRRTTSTSPFILNVCNLNITIPLKNDQADPGGRAVFGLGLRWLACWDCGFDSHLGSWMSVFCVCCELSRRGLYGGPIPHPEESYRISVCVCVCHLVW